MLITLALSSMMRVNKWTCPLSLLGVGILLVSYQTLVRYTWLGVLLNGRLQRPQIKCKSDSRNASETTIGACI